MIRSPQGERNKRPERVEDNQKWRVTLYSQQASVLHAVIDPAHQIKNWIECVEGTGK